MKKGIQIESEWIKGHQDDELEWDTITTLQELPLSNTATMNVWCDHQAASARNTYYSHPDAVVNPNEKWAVFTTSPISQIITGSLGYNILQTLHGKNME